MVQGKINRGRHIDHPTGRHFIRTNQRPPPPSPHFYRSDALPAAQPTASKHRRQLAHSDKGEDARVLLNGDTCTVSVHKLSVHYTTAKCLLHVINVRQRSSYGILRLTENCQLFQTFMHVAEVRLLPKHFHLFFTRTSPKTQTHTDTHACMHTNTRSDLMAIF